MIRTSILAITLVFACASSALLAQSAAPPKNAAPVTKKSPAPSSGQQHPEAGQLVFEQNCSRCHTAPDGFPPRISGAVAMHMRVRASLSQADAEALLRFLNP
jgi:cytochrome c5